MAKSTNRNPEIGKNDEAFSEVEDVIEEFTQLFHDDKVIGKVNRSSRIGEHNGQALYNADIEIEDDKHIPLFESKHRIVAQEGKLTLITL